MTAAPPPTGATPAGAGSAPPPVPTTTCAACRRDVPVGGFCGVCGAHLHDEPGVPPRARRYAFAAMPNEHVLSPQLVSTLFPHLPHRRLAAFRAALAVVVVVLVTVGLFRLSGPSVLVAAAAVPLLFLVYLYEVEVYEESPLLAVGLTFGVGLALGAAWAHWSGRLVTRALYRDALTGSHAHQLLVEGVLLPLGAQALMLAGPLVLRALRRYDEALDGFAFGAASALGFSLTATLVELWPELRLGVTAHRPLGTTVVEMLQRGVLVPVVAATATGLVAASLWLRHGPVRDPRRAHTGLEVTVAAVVVVDVVLGVLAVQESRPGVVLAVTAVVAAALLLRTRVALHHMLLAEAADDVTVGPPQACTHCHRLVPRMAFCAHCGVATRATSKAGEGRLHRQVRSGRPTAPARP